MHKLPQQVLEAWNKRTGPVVFATVDGRGVPNIIYATCVKRYDESTIVIADNYFDKTKQNIQNGSEGSVLFITESKQAYQVKGEIGYHTNGEIFDDMKLWNPKQHPGHAAAALKVREVYSGSTRLE